VQTPIREARSLCPRTKRVFHGSTADGRSRSSQDAAE
jgi:hypothetical protein